MNKAVESFLEELKSRDLKVSDVIELGGKTAVELNFTLKNTKVTVLTVFDDERTVAIRCVDYLRVTEDQYAQAVIGCNEMNKKMRWVKFVVNDENFISLEDDAIVDASTAGSEILELIIRMMSIADDAYPQINKLLWT